MRFLANENFPFPLPMPPPDRVGKALCQVLVGRDDWAGRFSVIEPGRIRMRELPE